MKCLRPRVPPSPASAFRQPCSPPPPGSPQPPEFVLRLAHDSATYPDILKQRVAGHPQRSAAAASSLTPDAKSTPVRDFASAADLWKAMLGRRNLARRSRQTSDLSPCPPAAGLDPAAATPTPEYPLILIAADSPPPHGSPLMSKLYRESGLRRPAERRRPASRDRPRPGPRRRLPRRA